VFVTVTADVIGVRATSLKRNRRSPWCFNV